MVAVRHGDIVVSITAFPRGDLMETTGRVKAILDRDPECRAMVDVIGLGAGVYDRLREQGMKADPFNAARKTTLKDKTGQFGFHQPPQLRLVSPRGHAEPRLRGHTRPPA